MLDAEDYDDAVTTLKPGIATSLPDLITAEQVSRKRIEKSADRTHAWLRDTLETREQSSSTLFASVAPLEAEEQQLYLQDLAEEYSANLAGLATYDIETSTQLPESLSDQARLCIADPQVPREVLRAVSVGNDLLTVPLVTRTSELGQAFTFSFPAPQPAESGQMPLILDMWSSEHTTSVTPLVAGCKCYTCTSHHRAYLHHLLQAKEMLAWTLLQVHNFAVFDRFFEGMRQSIKSGTFEKDAKHFDEVYEDGISAGEGESRRPRIRGYQMKSVGGDPKKNEKKWGRFENGTSHETTAELEEAAVEESAADSHLNETSSDLVTLGLAEKAEKVESR